MRVNILGAPELLCAERSAQVSPRLWCVLLSFVLSPGMPVQSEVLVDRLWGSRPTPKARQTIRTYIRRIELALSEAAGCEVRIQRQTHGYMLDISEQEIDWFRFREMHRQAEEKARCGELHQAATLLKQAESLWRGEPLAGLTNDWVSGIRAMLNEESRSVTARRIELEFRLGRHLELLGELADLNERYPVDGTFAAQRMLALFRADRQTDAIRVYQRMKVKLVEYGLEPDPGLEDLYIRILRRDPRLSSVTASRDHRRRPAVSTLPSTPTGLVGRADEVTRILATAQQSRQASIQVIEGMGGAGKTTLAVHAARLAGDYYRDGQLYLNLGATDRERAPLPPADALHDLLAMLGVEQIGDALPARKQQWEDELAARRVVLVLDDAAGPDQVAPLIPDDADCLILITARRRADWGVGESIILDVLPEDDAIELFTKIAGRNLRISQGQMARVVRLCDRLPLAVKSAAVRLRTSTAGEANELLRELDELRSGYGLLEDVGTRVNSIFDLSYRELTPSLQRFFRYLSVSPCREVSPRSASILTGITSSEAESSLTALARLYLLEERSRGQFGLHDLVRSYGRSLSQAEDSERETESAVWHLADYYAREAERLSDALRAREHVPGMGADPKTPRTPAATVAKFTDQEWLSVECENILLLAEYCSRHERKRLCIRLIHSISDFMEMSGHWERAMHAYETALRASRDLEDIRGAATSFRALSMMCVRTGRLNEALAFADSATSAFARVGDWNGRADATNHMGVVYRHMARFRDALAHHREAIDIFRACPDPIRMARAMVHAASALNMLGRHGEELAHLTEALGVFRQHGDLRGQGLVHNSIGLVHLGRGRYRDAVQSFQESRTIFHEIGGRQNLALLDHNMAKARQYRERPAEALSMYRKALAEFRVLGDLRNQAFVLINIGSVDQEYERYSDAMAHSERAFEIANTVGDSYACGLALCGIADAQRESDEPEAALACYERAARLAGETDAPYLKARVLHGMAEASLRIRGAEAARIYWREAYDLYAELGVYQAETVAIRLHVFAQHA